MAVWERSPPSLEMYCKPLSPKSFAITQYLLIWIYARSCIKWECNNQIRLKLKGWNFSTQVRTCQEWGFYEILFDQQIGQIFELAVFKSFVEQIGWTLYLTFLQGWVMAGPAKCINITCTIGGCQIQAVYRNKTSSKASKIRQSQNLKTPT